jgi:hypothetical protein
VEAYVQAARALMITAWPAVRPDAQAQPGSVRVPARNSGGMPRGRHRFVSRVSPVPGRVRFDG